MRSITYFAGSIAVLLVATSGRAQAPRKQTSLSVNRGSFAVSPYAGYLVSQTFLTGPLDSKLSVQSSPLYGVQASLPLAPGASLIGGVAYASGDLRAGLPIIGGISLGTSSTTLMDASVELRLENFKGRFIPIIEAGGGATHRTVTIAGMHASTTDFQVSGGIGADVPLTSNIAVRLLAKDYWGKADFGDVGGLFTAKTDDLHAIALSGGLRIAF
jgi:hypothetical protein